MGNEMMQGRSLKLIRAEVKNGFQTGRLHAPARPGVAYMLSREIRAYDPRTGTLGSFPPHVMFYAPHLTDMDIGSRGDFSYGLPSIGSRPTPRPLRPSGPSRFDDVTGIQEWGRRSTS